MESANVSCPNSLHGSVLGGLGRPTKHSSVPRIGLPARQPIQNRSPLPRNGPRKARA